jgi:hypothetical protein
MEHLPRAMLTVVPVPANANCDVLPKVLTRGVVARMLGCTPSGVRYFERKRWLTPKIDAKGIRRFERQQVEALARQLRTKGHRTRMGPTGALAAQVFRMFREHMSLADIVIHTGAAPETIRALWSEYVRPLEPLSSGEPMKDSR